MAPGSFEWWVFWVSMTIQVFGLASVAVARMSERLSARRGCQRLFFGSLAAVGVAMMVAVASGNGCWLSCGMTLALMAVGATLDLGREQAASLV